ncbi:MAG: AbrB family transcriptional regulator [Actinomycetota bacterium]|jgi:membrane AbrB-like protein|nr:AbrB family transcriptional regulator [Euzebyaceae bacterium]MDQ3452036.1 AbrB family transcriptional regulator [Actinomycetota bacterium]
MLLLYVLAAATACGLALQALHIPGGLIFGALIGAAAVSLVTGESVAVPSAVRSAAFIVIGATIGVTVTRSALTTLRPVLLPALLAAVLLILAGLGIAYLLRVLGLAPPGDVLATSPGALSVITAIAAEQGVGAVQVATFHLVRVILVLVSLPVVISLLLKPNS